MLKDIISEIGGCSKLFFNIIFCCLKKNLEYDNIFKQMKNIGNDSFLMIAITGLFTGMVLVVQMGSQFSKMGAESYIGGVVSLALVRELIPVLTSIVISGRIGAAIAAELGTMKVTEQIDALELLAVDPVNYLIVPKFIACIIMMPVLTIFADVIGVFGALLVSLYRIGISQTLFFESILDHIEISDIVGGLIKVILFGIIISVASSYKGINSSGGAQGVGFATTGAVVSSIIAILVSNYFISVIITNIIKEFL